MMGEWNLPEQAEFAGTISFHVDEILVEYNGPQIVTARGPRGRYIGVAADEDERAVRWIFAPITDTEFRALALGAVSTHDVIIKPNVYIVDVDHNDNQLQAWECDASQLSDENLPDAGVLLPKAARDALIAAMPQPEAPELRLERLSASRPGIMFRSLAEVLSAFQRLWNALAQAVSTGGPKERGRWATELSERAALSLAAAAPGSLSLRIEPFDVSVFEQAAQPFEDLVRAGDNPQALAEILARLGARVQARYEELLTDVERHQLQLLARRRGGVAFISPHTAYRVRLALPQGVYGEPKTKPAIGYFLAFDTTGATFEFFDETSDTSYRGLVHPDVLAENNSVAVGPGATHAVFIEVTARIAASKHVTETYVLRAIAPPPPPASRRSPEVEPAPTPTPIG